MIVDVPRRSVVPRCYNRPDMAPARPLHGIDQQTGERIVTEVRSDWCLPGCKTWDGVGIGQPTPEFPAGTPYPVAHGFDCRGCRHLPAEFKDFA
ncbi:MAG TPA: hypothetical protein VIG97_11490 [Luteimonas sp.]